MKYRLFQNRFAIAACLLGVSGVLLTGAGNANAGDWPEFRGPQQNGVVASQELPIEWSETENIRWFTKLKGLGWSSPIIVGDRIYLTSATNGSSDSQSGEDASAADLAGRQLLSLVCLDSKTGKELFSKIVFEQPTDAPKIHNKNSHASPTPVAAQGKIFVHFGHQGTACLDLDGNKVWENRDHVFPPTHGNGGSPILCGDRLIVTCDGGDSPYTLALEAATGKEIWKAPRNVEVDRPFSFCTPQVISVNGVEQIISPGSNIVQALSPKDGRVLWSVRYDGFSVVPRPVYHRGTLFVCTGFSNTKLLAIDPTGTGDVTETHVKWTYGTSASVPQTPSLVCYENQVILTADGGIATGVDTETGKELWRERLGGNYSASPLLSGNRVYVQGESGDAVILELGGKPKKIAKNSLPGRIFASYAVVDNDLIIRSEQGVYRVGRP